MNKNLNNFLLYVSLSSVIVILTIWGTDLQNAPSGSSSYSSVSFRYLLLNKSFEINSGTTEWVSNGSNPSISADGRYIAFNRQDGLIHQVYVYDRQTGQTELVSKSSDGTLGNDYSIDPTISADGRYVAFVSKASNLVDGDTNNFCYNYPSELSNCYDVFVHDRVTGLTERVSIASDGSQGNNESGNYGYYSNTLPSISDDGRFVAFVSEATNLVENDTNNFCDFDGDNIKENCADVFVHDRQTGQTELISVSSNGIQGNSRSGSPFISGDGRYVVFSSLANNLVNSFNYYQQVYLRDRKLGTTEVVSISSFGVLGNDYSSNPSISSDGRYIAFSSQADNLVNNDTNQCGTYERSCQDVFVYDRLLKRTMLVSTASDGTQGNADSGPSVVGAEGRTAISADGRFVAFSSYASNLVSDDTNNFCDDNNGIYRNCADLFVHDMVTEQTERVSVATDGTQANGDSQGPAISSNGRYVSFFSYDNALYGKSGVFIHDQENISPAYTPTPRPTPLATPTTIPPPGTTLDLMIDSVSYVQTVEMNQLKDYEQFLVNGKEVAIKVIVRKIGSQPINNVQVLLEQGQFVRNAEFFIDDPMNRGANGELLDNNKEYPLNFASGDVTKTIYFIQNYGTSEDIGISIDPNNTINETNETNNHFILPTEPILDTQWGSLDHPELYIHYFRTDWDRSFQEFRNFTQFSDDFISGLFPVASQRYKGDISEIINASTSAYRGLDNQLSDLELFLWMAVIDKEMKIAHPEADRFVAVVPNGWFSKYTSQQKSDLGLFMSSDLNSDLVMAEARVMNRPNGLSTAGHEIGHTYGLPAGLPSECKEEYDCAGNQIGNLSAPGFFTSKRIPINTSESSEVYCVMGRANPQIKPLDQWEFWVDAIDYGKLLNDHKVIVPKNKLQTAIPSKGVLVSGIIDNQNGVKFDDWYVLDEPEFSTLNPGPYELKYLDRFGNEIGKQSFNISFDFNGTSVTQSPFVFTIPYIDETAKYILEYNGVPIGEKDVSAHNPTVSVIAPAGGKEFTHEITIKWTGSDLDGDSLSYSILASKDNGNTWDTLAFNITDTSFTWNIDNMTPSSEYIVKVMVTDGFNTTEAQSAAFTVLGQTYLPILKQ